MVLINSLNEKDLCHDEVSVTTKVLLVRLPNRRYRSVRIGRTDVLTIAAASATPLYTTYFTGILARCQYILPCTVYDEEHIHSWISWLR